MQAQDNYDDNFKIMTVNKTGFSNLSDGKNTGFHIIKVCTSKRSSVWSDQKPNKEMPISTAITQPSSILCVI